MSEVIKSASEDFYATVRRDLRDMESGKLRICRECGSENGIVKRGIVAGIPTWSCMDCVPDEELHPCLMS